MGYVVLPSLYGLGAEVSASASVGAHATPKETFDAIVASSPEAEQIKSDWSPAIDLAGKFPAPSKDGKIDTNVAVDFVMQAAPLILEAAGIGGGSAEFARYAQGLAPEAKELIKGNPKPLAIAAVKAGAAYTCYYLGVPPEVGVVTVEALKDGELTDKDFEAAGGVGGSIGGAAICSVIGVPPCIGGFAGGLAGKAVGGVVADALKVGGGKAERRAKEEQRRREEAAIRGQLNQMREEFAKMILLSRGEWWANFDRLIDSYSYKWQSLECSADIGVRFPLLWESDGKSPTSPYFFRPYNASACAIPVNQNLSRGTGCLTSGLLPIITPIALPRSSMSDPSYVRCNQPYGCPYPAFPALGADDQWNERVVQAFASYDIWWQPTGNRQAIDQSWIELLPKPDKRSSDPRVDRGMLGRTYTQWIADSTRAKQGCKSNACKEAQDRGIKLALEGYKAELVYVAEQALSFEAVNAASMRISSDLIRTAATYAAAVAANANRTALLQGDVRKAVAKSTRDASRIVQAQLELGEAQRRGKFKNALINYGALGVGALLLGSALIKGRSR